MFGKGNWAVFGVEPSSALAFKTSLLSPQTLFDVSQLKASNITRFQNKATVGINPFAAPRKDEELTDPSIIAAIANILAPQDDSASSVRAMLPDMSGPLTTDHLIDFFGSNASAFALNDQADYFGFWVVFNDFEDLTDPASKKEQLSYNAVSRPYKFLNTPEKKGVDAQVKATQVTARKQFPVLVDFNLGRVFAETTNTDEIGWVIAILKALGAETFSLRWDFDDISWATKFLTHVAKEMKPTIRQAMATRADELTRFSKKEVEKLDDKKMEKIVSSYFAVAPLDTGDEAALKTPAKIKLHKPSDPITAADASGAFTLLGFSPDAFPASATVVFQELGSYFKKEQEITTRKDKFVLNIDDNMNNQDAGTALLKGFDLPQYKQEIMREIKKTKQDMPIKQYWDEWLKGMRAAVAEFADNITETLQIAKTFGLTRYASEAEETEVTVA